MRDYISDNCLYLLIISGGLGVFYTIWKDLSRVKDRKVIMIQTIHGAIGGAIYGAILLMIGGVMLGGGNITIGEAISRMTFGAIGGAFWGAFFKWNVVIDE